MLTTSTLLFKIGVELVLGFSIKLFIENGRIHPADFVNDFLFWLPGVQAQDGYGLGRQAAAMLGPVEQVEATESEAQRITG